MNKEFKDCETKKCSIDNLHPYWKSQELADNMIINEKELKQQNNKKNNRHGNRNN